MADHSLRPDHLLLTFRRKPGADSGLIPRQTPFSAGVDAEGLPIAYTTDQDLEAQACALEAMVTMRARGRILQQIRTPQEKELPRWVALDEVWLTEMALPLPYPTIGPLLPLFGSDEPRKSQYGVTSQGMLGFAVGSSLLALEGGQRRVTLTLRFSATSLHSLQVYRPNLDLAQIGRAHV